MSYSITDFNGGDLSQYFSDTWVQYSTKSGALRTGKIVGFPSGSRVLVSTDTRTIIVPLSSIRWTGLSGTRCIVWNRYLAFVSPAGTRFHKKPPTSINTVALIYRDGSGVPLLYSADSSEGSVPITMIEAYLDTECEYTTDTNDIITLIHNNETAFAITKRYGILYDRRDDRLLLIKDGIIIRRAPFARESIASLIREALAND